MDGRSRLMERISRAFIGVAGGLVWIWWGIDTFMEVSVVPFWAKGIGLIAVGLGVLTKTVKGMTDG
jgi:hypothetical protein